MSRYPRLEELHGLTFQGVFDHAARHLMTQGKRSTLSGSRACQYRDHRGGACAVGAFIPDALYSPDMENKNVDGMFMWCSVFGTANHRAFVAIMSRFEPLLAALQKVHDDVHPVQWLFALKCVAKNFGLHADVLEPFARNGRRDHYADMPAEHRPANASAFVAVPVGFVEPKPRMTDAEAFAAMMKGLQGPCASFEVTQRALELCDVVA